jgi:hypothetical protein
MIQVGINFISSKRNNYFFWEDNFSGQNKSSFKTVLTFSAFKINSLIPSVSLQSFAKVVTPCPRSNLWTHLNKMKSIERPADLSDSGTFDGEENGFFDFAGVVRDFRFLSTSHLSVVFQNSSSPRMADTQFFPIQVTFVKSA